MTTAWLTEHWEELLYARLPITLKLLILTAPFKTYTHYRFMKVRYLIGLFLALLLASPSLLKAQDLKKKYDAAEAKMSASQYAQALPLFLSIDSAQGDNNNVKFQIGECYLYSPIEKSKAIPYLQKACTDLSEKYNPSSLKEKHAPYDALFDLAKAYHANYQFDSASVYYTKFRGLLDSVNYKEM